MSSEVLFLRFSRRVHNIGRVMGKILEATGFREGLREGELVAIKLHFGERGNIRHLRPQIVKPIVDYVKSVGALPFLTDTTTLYSGFRRNAVEYIETAALNGFTIGSVGAPIIIADGLTGDDYIEVETKGALGSVAVASAIAKADALITLTHFKFHLSFGIGGALKNLAMGCCARKTKFDMHAAAKPRVVEEKCIGCGICVKRCRWGAITIVDRKAVIDYSKCVGCGDCVAACRYGGISISWRGGKEIEEMLRRAADAVNGVLSTFDEGKVLFINVLANITRLCDCATSLEAPLVPDIGILASRDPVAIDQASVDLVNSTPAIIPKDNGELEFVPPGRDKVELLYPNIKWNILLEEAEKLGIGTRKYRFKYIFA
ncbi:MAG: DUF362 domain-containing protein [Thermoproteales archaeon]|nr:DUF362 domain-containing protein [Thermoproteales archaeon]